MGRVRAQTTEPFWSRNIARVAGLFAAARPYRGRPASKSKIRPRSLAGGVPCRRESPRPGRSQHRHEPAMHGEHRHRRSGGSRIRAPIGPGSTACRHLPKLLCRLTLATCSVFNPRTTALPLRAMPQWHRRVLVLSVARRVILLRRSSDPRTTALPLRAMPQWHRRVLVLSVARRVILLLSSVVHLSRGGRRRHRTHCAARGGSQGHRSRWLSSSPQEVIVIVGVDGVCGSAPVGKWATHRSNCSRCSRLPAASYRRTAPSASLHAVDHP
jgi:hypothetical protein